MQSSLYNALKQTAHHSVIYFFKRTTTMNPLSANYLFSWIIAGSLFFIVTPSTAAEEITPPLIQEKLAKLEASSGGKIGIYAINTANGQKIHYRANQRFPMGCTSKVMGVAAILKKSMSDPTLLSQRISYTKKDLTNWAPIAEKHLNTGMTVAELCAASISYSDNTAMNLLVKKLGGLEKINDFARSIHNDTFRQDNGWPEEAMSGGPNNVYDSSTPKAMAQSLQQLALNNVLAKPQHELLLSWLKSNTTGDKRIRAGVPKGWIVGDKTGTGMYYGTTNDIGVIWPPQCSPVVIAVYYTNNNKEAIQRNDIVSSATRLVIDGFAHNDQCIRNQLAS